VYEWLHDELGRRAREELRDFCRKTDYIDQEKALQLIDKGRANQTWYLLNLALWWKEFIA
jgi:asparagine synthase (glutamine-hydrolysing)